MSSRSRWKLVAALTAVLVVGVVGARFLIRKSQERKEFVSKVGPLTEYRCRFTVSTGWQRHLEPDGGYYLEEHSTFTLPQNPIKQWIESRLLHRTPPPAHTITVTCGGMGGLREVHTVNGIEYFEPAVYPPEQIERERYFMIDNFSVTLATIKSGSSRATKLTAHSSGSGWPLELWLDGSAEEANFLETDREVQAIIASLHFDKVASTGGKQ